MARATVRIEIDYAGVGELLRSAEVQAMLEKRAGAVKDAADKRAIQVGRLAGGGREPLPITTVSAPGKRARVLVVADHPAGLRAEAIHRVLGASLEAANGA